MDEAALDHAPRDRDQRRHCDADDQHGGQGCGRKIDDEDCGVDRQFEEGIFLQARGAEIEAVHHQHRDPHRGLRMIDQPAVEARRQRALAVADRTQQRPSEWREHESARRQRIDDKHDRLAVGKSDAIDDILRQ
ncbi:hypothetical protein ACTGJ9_020450 [Bradyrhizobium sp. RDM12]